MYVITTYFWSTIGLPSTDPLYELFIELMLPQNCSTSLHWFAWLFLIRVFFLTFQKSPQIFETYGEIKGHLKTTLDSEKIEGRPLSFLRSLSPGKNLQQITVFGVMTSVAAMNHVPYQLYYQVSICIHRFCLLAWVIWTSCCVSSFAKMIPKSYYLNMRQILYTHTRTNCIRIDLSFIYDTDHLILKPLFPSICWNKKCMY